MDMCYDGALVMPSNYAVMDEEEMTYLSGGWTKNISAAKCLKISNFLNTGSAVCSAINIVAEVLMAIPAISVYAMGTMIVCGIGSVVLDISSTFFYNAYRKGGMHITYSKGKLTKGYGTV